VEAQKLALKSKLGNIGGNGDLISVIAEIVREEIMAQENQRKVKENGGVGIQISSQISELDSKVNTISLQYQKLENTLKLCETEITEVKNTIEEENDHNKTSIQKALRSISEEIDIKLHQFSVVNSPRNPQLGIISTVSEPPKLETKKEENVKESEELKRKEQQQQISEDKSAKEEARKIEEEKKKKKEEERKDEEEKKKKRRRSENRRREKKRRRTENRRREKTKRGRTENRRTEKTKRGRTENRGRKEKKERTNGK